MLLFTRSIVVDIFVQNMQNLLFCLDANYLFHLKKIESIQKQV